MGNMNGLGLSLLLPSSVQPACSVLPRSTWQSRFRLSLGRFRVHYRMIRSTSPVKGGEKCIGYSFTENCAQLFFLWHQPIRRCLEFVLSYVVLSCRLEFAVALLDPPLDGHWFASGRCIHENSYWRT